MAEECKPSVLRIAIPSCLEWLGIVDKVCEEIALQLGLTEDDANALAISVVEAGTNAIQHGHRHVEAQPVEFRFDLTEERIQIEVHDRGPGFDVEKVLAWDPTTPEALLAPRGRGIFIMKSLMDEVSFRIVEGEGCWVNLTKQYVPAPS